MTQERLRDMERNIKIGWAGRVNVGELIAYVRELEAQLLDCKYTPHPKLDVQKEDS